MPTLQLTLKKNIDNFCMSKGETLEFKGGKHKRKDIDQPFYPNFGPYHQLNLIAELLDIGEANAETKRLFKVEKVGT